MDVIKTSSLASIQYAEVRVSADELAVYETALKFALEKLGEAELERLFGATRDEIEGICEDVENAAAVCDSLKLVAV